MPSVRRRLARNAVIAFFATYHWLRRTLPRGKPPKAHQAPITPVFARGLRRWLRPALQKSARIRSLATRFLLIEPTDIPDGQVVQSTHGILFRVYPDWMYSGVYLYGEWEKENTDLLRRIVRESDIVFDIGANFGWFSCVLGQRVGATGKVFAFEPVPTIAAMCRENLALNDLSSRVLLSEQAMSSESGELVVHTFPGLPHGHSSVSDLGRSDAVPHTCRAVTLDQKVKEWSIQEIALIKIDVEGFEREVLQGGFATLSADNAPTIFFEINMEVLAARKQDPRGIFGLLQECGYDAFWLVDTSGDLTRVDRSHPVSANYLAAKGHRAADIASFASRVNKTVSP